MLCDGNVFIRTERRAMNLWRIVYGEKIFLFKNFIKYYKYILYLIESN